MTKVSSAAVVAFAVLAAVATVNAQATPNNNNNNNNNNNINNNRTSHGNSTANNKLLEVSRVSLRGMYDREDHRERPIPGISADCQVAISGRDVNPKCLDNIEVNPLDNDFARRCTGPADGNGDNRCSADQAKKALETLSAKCQAELSAGKTEVLVYYNSWQTYSLNYALLCSRTGNGDGEFCANPATIKPEAHLQCARQHVKLVSDWKVPVEDKYGKGEAIKPIRAASDEVAKQYKIENSSGSNNGGSKDSGKSAASHTSVASAAGALLTAGIVAAASLLL